MRTARPEYSNREALRGSTDTQESNEDRQSISQKHTVRNLTCRKSVQERLRQHPLMHENIARPPLTIDVEAAIKAQKNPKIPKTPHPGRSSIIPDSPTSRDQTDSETGSVLSVRDFTQFY